MTRSTLLLVLAVLLIVGTGTVQGQTPDSSAMQRKRLEFLVGSFATSTSIPSMNPSRPQRPPAKGTSVIAWALDSLFLSIQDASSLFGNYKAQGMLGYEPQTHQFVLSMFNNFGDHPTYRGGFVGDTLELRTTIAMPGRSFEQKIQWYKDNASVRLKVLNDLGKGFVLSLDQTATPSP